MTRPVNPDRKAHLMQTPDDTRPLTTWPLEDRGFQGPPSTRDVGGIDHPDNAPDLHAAHAGSGNIAGIWQARCTCGWRGPIVGDEATADADAALHVSVETSDERDGETLDEYRRRIV